VDLFNKMALNDVMNECERLVRRAMWGFFGDFTCFLRCLVRERVLENRF